MTSVPASISAQAHSLTPDELISLVKIEIFPVDNSPSVMLYLSDKVDVLFDGVTYSQAPHVLLGAGLDAGGEKSRPRLQMGNPDGMFSVFAQNGDLEMARVDRFRVHPSDVGTNVGIKNSWYVSRIESVNESMIIFELAALTDGPKVKLPAREFMYPEFRSVRLG